MVVIKGERINGEGDKLITNKNIQNNMNSEDRYSEEGKIENLINSKAHKTADTSIEAYLELLRTGQLKSERELVYHVLKVSEPMTSRQLTSFTRIERSSITRALK